jgi:hypothetical protein
MHRVCFLGQASFDTAFGLLRTNEFFRVMENKKQGFTGVTERHQVERKS